MGNKLSSSQQQYEISTINVNNLKPKVKSIVHKLFSDGIYMNSINRNRRHSFSSSSSSKNEVGSQTSEFSYGWYEDFVTPEINIDGDNDNFDEKPSLQRALSLPAPISEPPYYILEAPLKTQHLWYSTAGKRPAQPEEERLYFERLWLENFKLSRVNYNNMKNIKQHLNNTNNNEYYNELDEKENITPLRRLINEENMKEILGLKKSEEEDFNKCKEFDGDIMYKGKGPFSYAVSKSFFDGDIQSMTLQIPRYRVVRNKDNEIHAEFLIIVTLGSSSKVTFGVWRRHSEFSKFAYDLKENGSNVYKNALLSWECLVQRKRWFRCLEKDYLALKCFLLERFLQDTLFESSKPSSISNFLGLEF